MEHRADALSLMKNISRVGDKTLKGNHEAELHHHLRTLFDPLPYGYIIHHPSGVKFANRMACEIFQTDRETIAETYFMKYVTSTAQKDTKSLFLNAFKGGEANSLKEVRIPQENAESKIIDITIARLPWDGIGSPLVQVILEDNTEQLKKEAQLIQLSSLDPLTGAQNRRSFTDYYERVYNLFKGEEYGLVLFDLDHFKKVNDTYGHGGGDMALQITVVCCEAVLARKAIKLKRDQKRPMLARVGGEEFAIFIPHADLEETSEIAEAVRSAIEEQEIITKAHSFSIAASFGITCANFNEIKLDEVMRRADAALYAAKESGRNKVVAAADTQPAPPDSQRISRSAERPKFTQ